MEQEITKRINSYFDRLSTEKKIDKRNLAIQVIYSPAHYLKYRLQTNEKPDVEISLSKVLNISTMEEIGLKMLHGKTKHDAEREVQGWLIKGIRDEATAKRVEPHRVGLIIMNKEELKYFVLVDNKINNEINLLELINKYKNTA